MDINLFYLDVRKQQYSIPDVVVAVVFFQYGITKTMSEMYGLP